MLLKVQINDEPKYFHALNDVVIIKSDEMQLLSMDLYTDSEHVNHYIGDGLIIATPTGSTAYSISAGGPVADPRMSLYIATPICAHTLSARSAVLPTEKELSIRLGKDYCDVAAIVSIDGKRERVISDSDEIRITKSEYSFELIRIGTSSFYKTLVSKLL